MIALNHGGTAETLRGLGRNRPTGVHFDTQNEASLCKGVAQFEAYRDLIDPEDCRRNALSFSAAVFRGAYADSCGRPIRLALSPEAALLKPTFDAGDLRVAQQAVDGEQPKDHAAESLAAIRPVPQD